MGMRTRWTSWLKWPVIYLVRRRFKGINPSEVLSPWSYMLFLEHIQPKASRMISISWIWHSILDSSFRRQSIVDAKFAGIRKRPSSPLTFEPEFLVVGRRQSMADWQFIRSTNISHFSYIFVWSQISKSLSYNTAVRCSLLILKSTPILYSSYFSRSSG